MNFSAQEQYPHIRSSEVWTRQWIEPLDNIHLRSTFGFLPKYFKRFYDVQEGFYVNRSLPLPHFLLISVQGHQLTTLVLWAFLTFYIQVSFQMNSFVSQTT